MMRHMLLSKIHRATVTACDLEYEGSLTIPRESVEAAGLLAGEQILVANLSTGARFETYVMVGEKKGEFRLNGAAARLGAPGDRIIVMAFAWMDAGEAARHEPRLVYVDEKNRIVRVEGPGT